MLFTGWEVRDVLGETVPEVLSRPRAVLGPT